MDYIILIFLVQLTVYRQEKRKKKRLKRMKLNSFRSCSKYKNPKKTVVEFEFGIIKDRWIDAYLKRA